MTIAVSISFVDNSAAIIELLERKLRAGIEEAAAELAFQYKQKLSVPAPPHSGTGEMPRAYLGHKPGGFGPVYGFGEINNRPPFFAATQTKHLKDYIENSGGNVGFMPGHVDTRRQNYLIKWDTGQFFSATRKFGRRPWIMRGYREAKKDMIAAFQLGFES